MKRKLSILVVYDIREVIDPDEGFIPDEFDDNWKSETSVMHGLKSLGHEVESLALFNDIAPLVDAIRRKRPDLVFNLVEEFNHNAQLERNVVGILELLGVPYTGCGSAGIMLCKDKALAKQVMMHHDIPTAPFMIAERGAPLPLLNHLTYPLMVKPMHEEASTGISQASRVDHLAALKRRVRHIHRTLKQNALIENYIPGRELYVSMIGHRDPQVLPVRELKFRRMPSDQPRMATFQAKWNPRYRRRWGINEEFADPLPSGVLTHIQSLCRKAYRALKIDGYGRMDLRLTPDHDVIFLEANPNPFLAPDEDFAESAKKAGYPFEALLHQLLTLAFERPAA